ncbi:MAG: hypothetical protein ACYCVZ_05215 [Streptosporangiaceae bacterium]
MTGPFASEDQARELPEVRAIYALPPGSGQWQTASRDMLTGALEAAGVEMGAYDERIATWLAGWEPHVVAVIASWITRAAARPPALGLTPRDRRTILAALAEAADAREAAASACCEDCASAPAGACDRHADDIDQADAYRALARRIGGKS